MEINYKQIFLNALSNHSDNPKWKAGDFIGIKIISNTKVGSVGQDFVEGLCNALSISASFPHKEDNKRMTQSPWDISINDIKFELKTATEDVSGSFQFNHVRYHRPYDALLCLGVTPNELFFGAWSKAEVTTGKAGNLVSMEHGANASYKLTKRPKDLMPISKFLERITEFTANYQR